MKVKLASHSCVWYLLRHQTCWFALCLSEKEKRPLEREQGWTEKYWICRLIDSHYLIGMAKMRKFPMRQVTLEEGFCLSVTTLPQATRGQCWSENYVRGLQEHLRAPTPKEEKNRNEREQNGSLSHCTPCLWAEVGKRRWNQFCLVVWSAFWGHKLKQSFLEFNINMEYSSVWILLLSVFLRFIHGVMCVCSSFLSNAKPYFIACVYHNLFIHSLVVASLQRSLTTFIHTTMLFPPAPQGVGLCAQ